MAAAISIPQISIPQIDSLSNSKRPDFVEPLPKKYLCPVCLLVLLKPQQTECGHHVCESCLTNLFDKAASEGVDNVPCPVGTDECENLRNDGHSVVPDHRFRKEIMQREVFCFNKENGCTYQGKWNTLKTHLAECEFHLQDCKYVREGCPKKLLLKDFQNHVEVECQYILEECVYCKMMIPKIKMQSHHDNVCENYAADCPYGCGDKVERRKLREHKEICRKRPSKCEFSAFGCQYEGNDEQLKEHETKDMANHLAMLFKTLTVRGQQQIEPSGMRDVMLQVNRQQAQQEKKLNSFVSMLQKHEAIVQTLLNHMKSAVNDITAVKSAQQTLSHRVSSLENVQGGLTETRVRTIEEKVEQMELNVADLEQRIVTLEDAFYDGILIWKIPDYHKAKQDAVNGTATNLTSQPFYSSRRGYKMCCRVYLNGDGQGHKTHISLFFVMMKGKYDAILKWPFQQRVTLQLLDQTNRTHLEDSFKPDLSSSSFQRPINREMNVASGCPLFAAHSTVEKNNAGFIGKDNSIFIRVIVEPTRDKDIN